MSREPAADHDRLRAHGQLMRQIAGHLDNGQAIPCTARNRDAWTAEDDLESTAFAVEMCRSCPALQACGDYVTEFPEPSNSVWAGLTLADRNERTTPA